MTSTTLPPYSVSAINALARDLLESNFTDIRIEGEISNLHIHSSGHIYFHLKDQKAQIRCAFFRNRNQALKFDPEDGMHVLVSAQVSLYEARGEYQLIVTAMEQAGEGALYQAFEKLKIKLEKQGLFAAEHKKLIPAFPKTIGVVTSPTGAAVHDILAVLKRRFPLLSVIIYPTAVQGAAATAQIIQALKTANKRQECDLILLTRGGGSLEDLWCFNDEQLAHAIYNSVIPIVSAVGHEIDFTIADFVADIRAPTPSAAAELVSPDRIQCLENFMACEKRLTQLMQQLLNTIKHQLLSLQKQLRHPGQIIRDKMQTLDYLELNLIRAYQLTVHKKQGLINELVLRLKQGNPLTTISHKQQQQQDLSKRLMHALNKIIAYKKEKLENSFHNLDTVSPLRTLERGYSILKDPKTNTVISRAEQINQGDRISAKLASGSLMCLVEEIIK